MRHNFKKKFGQNFLKGSRFVNKLLVPLELSPKDLVIEIGPGDGMVTNKILESGAKVICVEIDYDLIVKLIKRFGEDKNFKIVNEDILKVNVNELTNKFENKEIKVVGALPYNISKKIIDKFLKHNLTSDKKVSAMSFIVQDEVAKDYVARAPKASMLSNFANIFADVKKLESIPASNFVPRPKVAGGILFFRVEKDIDPNYVGFSKLIRTGFSSPRKKVVSNLANVYDMEMVKKIFGKLNLDVNYRAADLRVEDWKGVYELIS